MDERLNPARWRREATRASASEAVSLFVAGAFDRMLAGRRADTDKRQGWTAGIPHVEVLAALPAGRIYVGESINTPLRFTQVIEVTRGIVEVTCDLGAVGAYVGLWRHGSEVYLPRASWFDEGGDGESRPVALLQAPEGHAADNGAAVLEAMEPVRRWLHSKGWLRHSLDWSGEVVAALEQFRWWEAQADG